MDKLYTTRELEVALGVSIKTIRDWKEKGLIEPLYTAGEYTTGNKRMYLYDIKLVKKSKGWKLHQQWRKEHFKNAKLSTGQPVAL